MWCGEPSFQPSLVSLRLHPYGAGHSNALQLRNLRYFGRLPLRSSSTRQLQLVPARREWSDTLSSMPQATCRFPGFQRRHLQRRGVSGTGRRPARLFGYPPAGPRSMERICHSPKRNDEITNAPPHRHGHAILSLGPPQELSLHPSPTIDDSRYFGFYPGRHSWTLLKFLSWTTNR